MALKRVWIPSPCYSSRGGSSVRLIIIHTAEGATTYQSLGSFFQNPANQVSSHVGIDDTPNTVGEYVQRPYKAWTAANYNPVGIQAELCAFAKWDSAEWNRHPNMLATTAEWVKEEAAFFGLPLVRLTASQAQGSGRGVCGHVDLGVGGGNHWDPGPSFPMDRVIEMAKGSPASTPVEGEMVASGKNSGGQPHVFWVGSNRKQIYYRWQSGGKWQGGGLFATTSVDISGLSCTLDSSNNFNVFARLSDGNVRYTWQDKGKSNWSGKTGSTPAGLIPFP